MKRAESSVLRRFERNGCKRSRMDQHRDERTSDSWLLCSSERAAAPSAAGVSSSRFALCGGVEAKHNAQISFYSARLLP